VRPGAPRRHRGWPEPAGAAAAIRTHHRSKVRSIFRVRAARVGWNSSWCPGCRLCGLPRPWVGTHDDAEIDRVTRKSVALSPHEQEGLGPDASAASRDLGEHDAAPRRWCSDLSRKAQANIPRRSRPLGLRGHRFLRSHGAPERKVKPPWLTLRCPANPSPSSATWIGFARPAGRGIEMPNEPKSRRNPGEPAIVTRRT
jgi:hypothetical protein